MERKVGYVVNQYPKTSHSFIRREIQELERQGVSVVRFSVRDTEGDFEDVNDADEYTKTNIILNSSIISALKKLVKYFVSSPALFCKTLFYSFQLGWKSEAGLLKHIVYFIEAVVLSEWTTEKKVNHLHSHFGTNSTTVAMLASQMANITFSFTVHGPEEFDKPNFIALPEKIKRAKFVIAITSYCKSQLFRLVESQYWNKIHIVRCGLDQKFFNPQAITNKEAEQNIVVCIGRLCEQKGQELLIRAFAKVRDNHIPFKLKLIGDGDKRDSIERLIESHSLNEHVTLMGWQDEATIINEICHAKFTVLPSFAEGLPVSIMESMALKKPVLSTYIAGIPELIISDQNGWLVPAGDVDALSSKLETILSLDSNEITQIGLKARTAVGLNHNINTEATKLKNLFLSNSIG